MGVRPVGVSIGSLSKFFPQQVIEAILRETGRAGERRRKLPALDLMYFVIALGLYASEGCRAVLRRVMVRGRGQQEEFDGLCTDSAITQGRTRLSWQPLRALYELMVRPIATRSSVGAWYRRWRLVTLDGSGLDVADTKRNERAFGRPGAIRGKSGFPQLRFVTLLENGTHVMFGAEFAGRPMRYVWPTATTSAIPSGKRHLQQAQHCSGVCVLVWSCPSSGDFQTGPI
jgi:hypothetical protein